MAWHGHTTGDLFAGDMIETLENKVEEHIEIWWLPPLTLPAAWANLERSYVMQTMIMASVGATIFTAMPSWRLMVNMFVLLTFHMFCMIHLTFSLDRQQPTWCRRLAQVSTSTSWVLKLINPSHRQAPQLSVGSMQTRNQRRLFRMWQPDGAGQLFK